VQEATDTYKALLLEHRELLALNMYVALCYAKLDYYDVSSEILQVTTAWYLCPRKGRYCLCITQCVSRSAMLCCTSDGCRPATNGKRKPMCCEQQLPFADECT
jgi:hypothetical protein